MVILICDIRTKKDINDTTINILDFLRDNVLEGVNYKLSIDLSEVDSRLSDYKNGDIIRVDYGEGEGYENSGIMDSIVIQNNIGNKYSPTLIVAPILKNTKPRMITDVEVDDYIIKTNRISVIDKSRIIKKIGKISVNLHKIKEGILYNLDLINTKQFNAQCKYYRGDIVLIDLKNTVGSEQHGLRPCVILQNNIGNYYGNTTVIAPLTEKNKNELPTHYIIDDVTHNNYGSTILFEQIRTIDTSRIIRKLDKYDMDKEEITNLLTNILFE